MKYQAEMKRELEEAERHKQMEVEQTKLNAEQQLNMQRNEYEERLAQLEKTLVSMNSVLLGHSMFFMNVLLQYLKCLCHFL